MPSLKIGFDAGVLSLRGTHIATYDYAIHNQTILSNQSIIFYQGNSDRHDPLVLQKFQKHFQMIAYDDLTHLNQLAEAHAIDRFYLIKSGENDGYLLESVPNLVHAVFPKKMSEAHGSVYAYVSEWLSKECANYTIPFVPHMISLPKVQGDLRNELCIPKDAKVFAYYGGQDSFNLLFVKEVIQKVVQQNPHCYFIFMNIPAFTEHRQAIFLPGKSDLTYKSEFINTADAMIHARGIGESFGLACGEFSAHNKPVITYALSPQRSHLDILGSRALLYRGPKELERIFTEFDRSWSAAQDWDCYSQAFSPESVMLKFNEVFLQGVGVEVVAPNLIDHMAVQGHRFRKKIRSLSRKYYLKHA